MSELLGRVADELRALHQHALAELGILEDFRNLLAEPRDDLPRSLCRREQPVPLVGLVIGEARLPDRLSTIVQYVRAGRIRALGISSLERSPALPDVPTIASAGFPGFEAKEWYGLVAPAGTPMPIVARLNREIVRIMHLPEINARIVEQGAEIVADSPDQFGVFIKAELAKWTKIVRETRMRLE